VCMCRLVDYKKMGLFCYLLPDLKVIEVVAKFLSRFAIICAL